MGLIFKCDKGQTPLDEDEKEGLLIKTIATRNDLDEFEQHNIEEAVQWSLSRKFKLETILSEEFIKKLHKQMFHEVWSWAGSYRKTNKNIGVDKFEIGIEMKMLLDDCDFWINNNTFDHDEIAVRFKHRLVKIHLFPNGNGRHSRLMGDIMINHAFNRPVFTWGCSNLSEQGRQRGKYLRAVKEADAGNYSLLIDFARS